MGLFAVFALVLGGLLVALGAPGRVATFVAMEAEAALARWLLRRLLHNCGVACYPVFFSGIDMGYGFNEAGGRVMRSWRGWVEKGECSRTAQWSWRAGQGKDKVRRGDAYNSRCRKRKQEG